MNTWRSIAIGGLVAIALAGCARAQTPGSAAARPSESAGGTLPKDVYPDSRNRLPLIRREQLDERRRKLYDEAAGQGYIEGLQGEAGIRLHSATVDPRFESPVGRRLTELAILVGAREAEQNFEWSLHVGEARRQGLEVPIIDIVRLKKPAAGLGDKETAIITLGREMAWRHKVSPQTFAAALKALGEQGLVDMSVTLAERANETPLIWVDQHLPLDWQEVAPLPIPILKSPPDIDPRSRSRLPYKEGQRAPTPGRTLSPYGMGPGQIALHSAEGKFLEANLGRRLLELATLVTARELDQQVVWTLHELEARRQGLEPAIIDLVRLKKPLVGLGDKETMVIEMGRELIGKHHVASDTYARAVKLFGERDALDLATRMGADAATCGLLTIFDQQLPPGQKPLLPVP